jgi:ABC-type transporter Mla subunit MlaD
MLDSPNRLPAHSRFPRRRSDLLAENDPNLGITIANLLTTSELAGSRQPALEELLSALPAMAAAGDTVVTKDGASFGLTLTFFDPLPCTGGRSCCRSTRRRHFLP